MENDNFSEREGKDLIAGQEEGREDFRSYAIETMDEVLQVAPEKKKAEEAIESRISGKPTPHRETFRLQSNKSRHDFQAN